jgi:SAM-dependent methyltransferase
MDLDEHKLFNETIAMAKIPRITHRIERFQKLPNLGAKFDLIHASSICFDCHGSDHVWGVPEWEFFLADIFTRLKPGGRIAFVFNPGATGGHEFKFMPDEVANSVFRKIPSGTLSSNKERFLLTATPETFAYKFPTLRAAQAA